MEESFYFAAETTKMQKLPAAFTYLKMDFQVLSQFFPPFLPIVSAF